MSQDGLIEKSHKYIDILQATIQRMATNSSNCKAWCITIESGILVVVADKNQPHYIAITIVPILLFLYLDAFYLSLEKTFINKYNSFVKGIMANPLEYSGLYDMKPMKKVSWKTSVKSKSIYPFYLALLALSIGAYFLLNANKVIDSNLAASLIEKCTPKKIIIDTTRHPEPNNQKQIDAKH